MTKTHISAGLCPATSLDALCSKSATSCLDAWRTSFGRPSYQGHHFLSLKGGNRKSLQPSYTKGGSWLPFIGESVMLCARATRATLNHAPIGEFSASSLQSTPTVCVAIARWKHILANCSRFSHAPLTDHQPSLKHFVAFLKEHPSAFAFTPQDCLPPEPPSVLTWLPFCTVDSFSVSFLSVSLDSVSQA